MAGQDGTRAVIQDPNAGAAGNLPQPVNSQLMSIRAPDVPAARAANNVVNSLGLIGDMLSDKIKTATDAATVDGKAMYLSGVAEQDMRKTGNYYTEQGYENLKIANDTTVYHQTELDDIPNQVQKTPEQYQQEQSQKRAAYLAGIKDPDQKAIAVAQFERSAPQLAAAQVAAASDYNKAKYSQQFGVTLGNMAGTNPDTPRVVPGGSLAVSPSVIAKPLQVGADERDLGIKTILGEAGGEGDQGMAAVALVIKNRVADGSFGKSARDVILAPSQFSIWNRGAKGSGLDEIDPSSSAYQKAGAVWDNVMAGKVADITAGATHYYAPSGMKNGVAPSWFADLKQKSGNDLKIGNQIFTGRAHNVDLPSVQGDGSPDGNNDASATIGSPDRPLHTVLAIPASANVGKIDPRLVDVMRLAAADYDGKAEVTTSGGNNGRAAGTTNHSSGRAMDIQLYDKDGNKIDNYQNGKATPAYQKFANRARQIQQEKYPELGDSFRWGGYFSGRPGKYGALDSMHFDIAGSPGKSMLGGSWDNGFTPDQMKNYGITDNQGLGSKPSAPAVGTPGSNVPNTQLVDFFKNTPSQTKYAAAVDRIVTESAQGSSNVLNAFGGINALQGLGFSDDQIKTVVTANQTMTKRKQDAWNLDRFKTEEQLVEGVKNGGDYEAALQKVDQYRRSQIMDDGHATALANKIMEAHNKFGEDTSSGEFASAKVQRLISDRKDQMRKSIIEGDGSFNADAAVKTLDQENLSPKTKGQITKDLFSAEEGFKNTARDNPRFNANKVKKYAAVQEDIANGHVTASAAIDQVNADTNLSDNDKKAYANNFAAAGVAYDQKKIDNPDFNPDVEAWRSKIMLAADNGADLNKGLEAINSAHISQAQKKAFAQEYSAKYNAYVTKNKPDPLSDPVYLAAAEQNYRMISQLNSDNDPTNDVDPAKISQQMAKRFGLNQDDLDKATNKFFAEDAKAHSDLLNKMERAKDIAQKNKALQDNVNSAIANDTMYKLTGSFNGEDPFHKQDVANQDAIDNAVQTVKSQALAQAKVAAQGQGPQQQALIRQTANQTVYRKLAKNGVPDKDGAKQMTGALTGDIIDKKTGLVTDAARQAFDDWRTMRDDPNIGPAYADSMITNDDVKTLLHQAYISVNGDYDMATALTAAKTQLSQPFPTTMDPSKNASFMGALNDKVDTLMKDAWGPGMFGGSRLMDVPWQNVTEDDRPRLLSDNNMSVVQNLAKVKAIGLRANQPNASDDAIINQATTQALAQTEVVQGNMLVNPYPDGKSIAEHIGLQKGQLGDAVDYWFAQHAKDVPNWQSSDDPNTAPGYPSDLSRAQHYRVGIRASISNPTPAYTIQYNSTAGQFVLKLLRGDGDEAPHPQVVTAKQIATEYNNYLAHPSTAQRVMDATQRFIGSLFDTGVDEQGTTTPFGQL